MSSHTINVAAVYMDIAWVDRKENLYEMRRRVLQLRHKADIAVLPELFSTGFVKDPSQMSQLADTVGEHPSLDAMKEAAAEAGVAVCGSVLYAGTDASGNRVYFNRCYFVEPSGEVEYYDKRHLFSLTAEAKVLKAGNRRSPVIRFRGCNIAMAVCYDLRFPEWMRNNADNPYDLLLIPANWPESREHAWTSLLCARAIENQCYVVGTDRTGSDDMGTYGALSRIFSPQGHSIGTDNPNLGALIATVDLDALRGYRAAFPVLRDI